MYLLCSLSVSVFAQNNKQKITGTVYNENKEPLPGVVVRINNTAQTTTGGDGKYAIVGKWNADEKIEFAYIGYRTRSFATGNRKILNVTMKEGLIELDGCIVTAKTNINAIDLRAKSGVVESVDMKRVESKPMIDFALSLQGQIPGLVVTNTGELGSNPEIRIRGNSSLRKGNTTNEPLYVLDGQVISADVFYNLNPSDIKSMKVLKDAAACALYGVKAANGVLEISSQRGYNGTKTVNYSANIGITTRGRRGVKMMKSAEKLELERLLQNPETPGYRYSADYYNKYYSTDPNLETLIAEGEEILNTLRNTDTDWFEELLRTNVYHSHNLSLKGGNGETSYYVSSNYAYQGGRIEGNDKQRMGVRLNLDHKLGTKGYLMMSMMKKNAHPEFMAQSQALKDATMAWNISKHQDFLMVHFNGNYHTDGGDGIIHYLKGYWKGVKFKSICSVRQEDISHLDECNIGRADFYICVPEDMVTTY